jgi:hypothetical protein
MERGVCGELEWGERCVGEPAVWGVPGVPKPSMRTVLLRKGWSICRSRG